MRAPPDPSCALQERCFVSSFRPRQLKSNVVFQRNVGADRSAIDSEISKFHKERERIARESRNPQTSNESTELEDALEQNRRWGFGQLGPSAVPGPFNLFVPPYFYRDDSNVRAFALDCGSVLFVFKNTIQVPRQAHYVFSGKSENAEKRIPLRHLTKNKTWMDRKAVQELRWKRLRRNGELSLEPSKL